MDASGASIVSEAEQRHARYTQELHSYKTDLQQLKTSFFKRQIDKGRLIPAAEQLAQLGPVAEPNNPEHELALGKLQRVVARALLDPACQGIIAADTLHKKLLAGRHASEYRANMGVLRQPDLSRLLHNFSQHNYLQCSLLDINGNLLLCAHNIDTDALRSFLGDAAEDPIPELQRALVSQQRGELDVGAGAGAVDDLLKRMTAKQREHIQHSTEVHELLSKKTAKEQAKLDQYRTHGTAVLAQCEYMTKELCMQANNAQRACRKMHKRKVLFPWTDERLGNCRFLDSCNNTLKCKCVHWENDPGDEAPQDQATGAGGVAVPRYLAALQDPQWINCDVRNFDWSILGKFGVIMTDPPWHIRQELPYGTMSDDEMRRMGIAQLQDDGVIFMWVTGRALELGRELLHKWGYKRVDELIWVKTNVLRRLIVSGRTGHWLNHSKEHCLVGYKGRPAINRHVDCDVVMAEVRETSRKPDEMYPLLERLSPGTRKLEIFARPHNVRPGWVSMGNQLDGTHLTDPDLLARYTLVYGPPMAPQAL